MLKTQPCFSIVIPTYNRPERLATCLDSLTQLDYPRDRFEVIVVDDGSATPLDSIVSPFQACLNIQLIRQKNAGPASARNTGAEKASNEFLVFTDDDCQLDPNWLQIFAEGFEQYPKGLLGGHTLNKLFNNLYSEASQLLLDYLYTYYNNTLNEACFFASNNFALPKEQFLEMKGFDTTFPLAAGEDRELCDRWSHHNYPMVYLPKALVYHSHFLTLRTFWRQHFNYGRGAFHFRQVRSLRNLKPVKVEPFKFYINLLRYPFSTSSKQSKILLASLFFVSQVANVSGFFWELFQQKISKTLERLASVTKVLK